MKSCIFQPKPPTKPTLQIQGEIFTCCNIKIEITETDLCLNKEKKQKGKTMTQNTTSRRLEAPANQGKRHCLRDHYKSNRIPATTS